uniref:Allatostatin-A receptor-like n=1 Tax=Saccoglossus kowalevskii TaxID=10224 RepID=A0ABM0LTW2_SACKO|nr:PREDICTED: allatostatin-A receptor-like [Saccoglossus kowalevskii]
MYNVSINASISISAEESVLWTAASILLLFGLFGTVGNIFVIIAFLHNKHLRTLRYVLVVNLSLSDLLVLIVTILPVCTAYLAGSWIFGLALCKLQLYILSLCTFVTLQTISITAVHRCLMVTNKALYNSITTRKSMTVLIVAVWMIAVVPIIVIKDNVQYSTNKLHCVSVVLMREPIMAILIGILNVTVFASYLLIAFRIRQCNMTVATGTGRLQVHPSVIAFHELQLLKTVFVVFVVLIGGYLPMAVVRGIAINFQVPHDVIVIIYTNHLVLVYCLNPLIYAIFNVRLRRAFLKIMCIKQHTIGVAVVYQERNTSKNLNPAQPASRRVTFGDVVIEEHL